MLLFDSEAVAAEHRLDAIREMLRGATHPASFGPSDSGAPGQLRFRAWSLGGGSNVFCAEGTGMYLRRKEASRFLTDDSLICLSVQPSGRGRISQGGHQYDLRPRSLFLTNMCDEYDYAWDDWGASSTYQVGVDVLGLSPADIAAAAPRLAASPLYPIVREHLIGLTALLKAHGTDSAALSYATSDMTRALVISVLGDAPSRAIPGDDNVLWGELSTFLRLHLRDPALDERAIARALGVQARELRRLAEERGISLMDLVTVRRLEGARGELAATGEAERSVASTARRWGFASAAQLTGMLANDGADGLLCRGCLADADQVSERIA